MLRKWENNGDRISLNTKNKYTVKKNSCADNANDKISICQLTTGQKTRDKLLAKVMWNSFYLLFRQDNIWQRTLPWSFIFLVFFSVKIFSIAKRTHYNLLLLTTFDNPFLIPSKLMRLGSANRIDDFKSKSRSEFNHRLTSIRISRFKSHQRYRFWYKSNLFLI